MDEPEKGVRELAKSLGLGKSSVSRLMATLACEGFLKKNPDTQQYRLGASVLSLATIATSNLELYKEAVPFIKRLVDRIGETAHLGILEGTDLVYLHKVECTHAVRIFTHIGKRSPAYSSGCGKAILAYQNEEVVNKVIKKGLRSVTEHTITNPDDLRNHLEIIRKQGYAIGMEELFDGIVSIAAPIRDYTGEVIGALNVVGPAQRIKRKDIPYYSKEVMQVANDISENLGY
jgi:IclR family transcriptional regulator, KDG regulon repressor